MSFVLNTVYLGLLIIGSPWLLWRRIWRGKNRRGWSQKLFGLTPMRDNDRPCIWFHAVSVGEVNLLAPILQQLNSQRPDVEFVISTSTESGFDLAQEKYVGLMVFFFPLDFSWAIKNALKRIKPNLIVLSELEMWPNFIRLADQHSIPETGENNSETNSGVPVAIVNARLSESSYRGYRRLGFLMSDSFQRLSLVMAQNETYATRFRALGCCESRVVVTGSVKFDDLQTDRENQKTRLLASLAGLQRNEFVFVAGSTQFEEDLLSAEAYRQLVNRFPRLRLILVPRHPERVPQLVRALNQLGLPVQLRSRLELADQATVFTEQKSVFTEQKSVLVVDVIGELTAWWGVADAAYVGGSMGSRGGQNMIEPAAYGIPVAFGPSTVNFQEVVAQLLNAEAATVVHDLVELSGFVERALTDTSWAGEIGIRAQNVVLQHDGASERTANYLGEILVRSSPNGRRSAA